LPLDSVKFFAEFHSIFKVDLGVSDHGGNNCVRSLAFYQVDQAADLFEGERARCEDFVFHGFFFVVNLKTINKCTRKSAIVKGFYKKNEFFFVLKS